MIRGIGERLFRQPNEITVVRVVPARRIAEARENDFAGGNSLELQAVLPGFRLRPRRLRHNRVRPWRREGVDRSGHLLSRLGGRQDVADYRLSVYRSSMSFIYYL